MTRERLRGPRRRPGLPRLPDRDRRRADPLPLRAPLVPERPGRQPARAWWATSRPSSASPRPCRSTPAASASWPATTSRRPRDLGVPLVGIGLFYRNGYFRQSLSLDGWQQERFPELDPYAMAIRAVRRRPRHRRAGAARRCVCPGLAGRRRAHAALPARHRHRGQPAAPPPGHRPAVRRRHRAPAPPGDRARHRRRPGPAGHRARRRRCSTPTRATPASSAWSASASWCSRASRSPRRSRRRGPGTSSPPTRPVPAGIDRFPRELMESTSTASPTSCGITFEELMRLGQRDDEPDEARFNMAVMGLRLAARANGVAKLHGAVSRSMFAGLWPDVPVDEVPITSITNGVHAPTWVSPEIDALLVAPRPARLGRGQRGRLGPGRRHPRRRAVAGPRAGARAPGDLRPRAPPRCPTGPGRRVSDVAWTDDRPRPEGAHDRLRPAVRHLQAGHPAALAARPAEATCSWPPTAPSSSCSPARPTRPTSRARS